MLDEIAKIWRDIETWLAKHAPDRRAELLDGASATDIARIEGLIGKKLPPDYAASLRIHDGAASLTSYVYMGIDGVEARWDSRSALKDDTRKVHDHEAGVIKPVWWNIHWLPFAEDSGGNLLCLDMDPGPKGTSGQLLTWEMSMGPVATGFGSFASWLSDYRDGLHDGRYTIDDGYIYEK